MKGKGHLDASVTRFIGIINRRILYEFKKQPKAFAAYVIPNSWDPKDGTIAVRIKHTAYLSQNPDGSNSPLDQIRIPLQTGTLGHQYGPRGYEDVTVFPRADGLVAVFEHGEDTSPKAPVGENWLVHYSKTAVIDLWIKLTESMGINILAGPIFHVATAPNGVVFDMNDSTGITQIGATGLDATNDAVATRRYVHQYVDMVYNTHTHPGVQNGSGSTGTPSAQMSFQGSQTVRAKQ